MEHLMVEQWNRDGGTVERMKVKQENRNDQKVEDLMLEKWNI